MPNVSVIIPNYNHSPYLNRRIDSVLNQTYQDFEIIILDDCSPDNSRDVIDQYRGNTKVSHIVFNERNSGSTFRQWKKGLELARGNWIWIAESDDYSDSRFLEEMLAAAAADGVGIVFCNSVKVDKNNAVIEQDESNGQVQILEGKTFIKTNMAVRCTIYNASSAIFKRALGQHLIDDTITSFKYCGDWFFWVKLLEQTNVAHVGKNLNYFRKHANNVSGPSEINGLFFIEGMQVYNYVKTKILASVPETLLLDKQWAYKLTRKKYRKSVFFKILLKAMKVNVLFPGYYLYYKFKKIRHSTETALPHS